MAVPTAIYLVQLLAASTNASISNTDTDNFPDVVDVQCTSVSLKYLTGDKIKRASSEYCSENKKFQEPRIEQKKYNSPAREAGR